MPYIDDDFKPKPYGDLAYNNSGRNLLVYYPWRGGVKTTGPSPTPVTPTPTPSGGISPTPTPSSTVTPTPTTTVTPTPSITTSPTPTPSATLTPTPTPSATPAPPQQLLVLYGTGGNSRGGKSYDGINWSGVTYSLTNSSNIAYSDTLGMFVSSDGRRFTGQKLSYSYSGSSWTTTGPSTADRINDLKWISYLNRFITAPNESSGAYYSDDGINWTGFNYPIAGSSDLFLITEDTTNNQIIAGREDGEIYTTYSGGTFTLRDNILFSSRVIPYHNDTLGLTVAIQGDCATAGYSYDGINWSGTGNPLSGGTNNVWSTNSITHRPSDGLMLAVSYTSNNAMTSTDGINWSATTTPISGVSYYLVVEYVPDIGLFVLINRNGDIWTSPDASTWTARTKVATDDVFTIIYGYIS